MASVQSNYSFLPFLKFISNIYWKWNSSSQPSLNNYSWFKSAVKLKWQESYVGKLAILQWYCYIAFNLNSSLVFQEIVCFLICFVFNGRETSVKLTAVSTASLAGSTISAVSASTLAFVQKVHLLSIHATYSITLTNSHLSVKLIILWSLSLKK